MEIGKYVHFGLFKSPCIETRRLKNLLVLEHAIKFCIKKFKIPILKTVPLEVSKQNLLRKKNQ